MRSSSHLTSWLKYKRYSDNREVSARLVRMGDTKYMEVKESRIGPFHCPACGELLTQATTGAFPNFFLEPKLFHEKHKPV